MFQFRLGPIPVRVAGSHILFSGLLGLLFLNSAKAAGGGTWPGPMLLAEGTPGMVATIAFIASWALIIFVSVLVHELGHALVSLAYGYRPDIELVWMGGHTRPNAPGALSWGRDILITFAGPTFGLLLGLAAGFCYFILGMETGFAGHMFQLLFAANLFWAVLNLIPVLPLDGGRISMVALSRLFGQKGFIASQVLALVIAGLTVFWALKSRQIFLLLFFGSYALQAYQLLRAGLKNEAGPAAQEVHPLAHQLQQAASAFDDGRLDRTKLLAEPLLAEGVPPTLRSLTHRLLGWVAIKEGKGQEALDHFAQVGSEKVEAQALAAGFSLIGDDARAVSLWEQAYREKRSPTVLHEWAGALWREGKKGAALDLPGIDPVQVAACTTRVPYIRGDFARAAALGEEALALHPHLAIAYDIACAHARAGRHEEALRFLEQAAELGFDDAARAAGDDDFVSLRDNPAFQQWLRRLPEKKQAMTMS
jgi:Zn-dependent protease